MKLYATKRPIVGTHQVLVAQAPKNDDPTFPIMHLNSVFIRPSLTGRRPCLSNSMPPVGNAGFLLKMKSTAQAKKNLMTSSGLIFSDFRKLPQTSCLKAVDFPFSLVAQH